MSYPPPPDPNRNFDPLRNQPVPGARQTFYPPASRPMQPQADRCPICNNVVSQGAVRLVDGVYHSHCALAHANAQIAELAGRLDQIVIQAQAPAPAEPSAMFDPGLLEASLEDLNQRLGTVEANQGGKVGRGDLRALQQEIESLREAQNTSATMISNRINDLEEQIRNVRIPGGTPIELPELEEEEEADDADQEDAPDPAERWDSMSRGARNNAGLEAGYKDAYCQVIVQKEWADLGKSAQKRLKKVLDRKD